MLLQCLPRSVIIFFLYLYHVNGHCSLVTYEDDLVSLGLFPGCLEPYSIKVAENFLPVFKRMVEWGKECRVKLIVCRSFRKTQFPLPRKVFREDMNHFIGHAIDLHLLTIQGYCGGFCLYRKLYKGARCFLRKVKLGGVRWGGDIPQFTEPTHFDDHRYGSNPPLAMDLLRQVSEECDVFGYIDL